MYFVQFTSPFSLIESKRERTRNYGKVKDNHWFTHLQSLSVFGNLHNFLFKQQKKIKRSDALQHTQ